jgi:hypothetical protein
MTSRPRTQLTGERSVRPFRGALSVAVLAALLLAAAAFTDVVAGAEPAFASAVLLVVLAVVPVAVAVGYGVFGRPMVSAGVLVGLAALVPGRILVDLQFAVDSSESARPALYLPESLASPSPAIGWWLLIGGQVALGAAGVLSAVEVSRQSEFVEPGVGSTRWLPSVLTAAVLAAVGLLMTPFDSDDAYLLGQSAFEGPAFVLAGLLLVAGALPLVAGLAASSGSTQLARGCVLGLGLGTVALVLPDLVAAWSVSWIHPTAGPVLATVAAVGLVVRGATMTGGARQPAGADRNGDVDSPEVSLPGGRRLHVVTGVLAVLTGAASVAGALTDQVVSSGGGGAPDSAARYWLLAAGLLVGVLGLTMFVPSVAAAVRPVLSVSWAGVALAGTAVLDVAVAANELGATYAAGQGVLWTVLAMVGAAVMACCSAIAGMVEREDAENSEDAEGLSGGRASRIAPTVITPLVATVVLAVAAFGTPVISAPEFVPAGLWSEFGTPSWGLLAAALTVLGAAALVPSSRAARAVALLVGVACLLVLRAAELPLAGSAIDGAVAGSGLWLAIAGALAALLTAGLVLTGRREAT